MEAIKFKFQKEFETFFMKIIDLFNKANWQKIILEKKLLLTLVIFLLFDKVQIAKIINT